MSLVIATGFEVGSTAGWTTGRSDNKFATVATGSLVTTSPHSGTYCYERNTTGKFLSWTTSLIGASMKVGVLNFWVYFPSSLPSAEVAIAQFSNASCQDYFLTYNNSTGKFKVHNDDGTVNTDLSTGPTADTWHHIEFKQDTTTTTAKLDTWLDGVAQTQMTKVNAVSTIASVGFPFSTVIGNGAGTFRIDDVAIYTNASAITTPIGPHHIQLLKVDPAGTITVSGSSSNFDTFTSNGTLAGGFNATTARTNISEWPPTIGSTAAGLVQITTSSTDYVQIPMTSYTLTGTESVAGARMCALCWAADATGSTLGLRSYDGTSETLLEPGTIDPLADNSTTAPAWATGIFTPSVLTSISFRVGFSSDAAPDVGIHAIYAEVALLGAPATNAAAQCATVAVIANQPGPSVKTNAANALATTVASQAAPVTGVSPAAGVAAVTATAYQTTSLVKPGSGAAAVTATSNQPGPDVKTNAANALATTAAGQASVVVGVSASAGVAAVTATSNQPGPDVKTNAASALATTTANQPGPSVKTNAANALATTTSNQPGPDVRTNAANALATTAAYQTTSLVKPGSGAAAVTATSNQPGPDVKTNAGTAATTTVAGQASAGTTVLATAEVAAVTATSNQPGPDVKTNAANALATTAAGQASVVVGVSASAGVAAVTATSNQPGPDVKTNASNAAATTAAYQTTSLVSPGPSVAIAATAFSGSYSFWTDRATPQTPAQTDTASVEVGIKFVPLVDGVISGIRFYKGLTNTGTHIGNLWTSDGSLLAQATFTGETASGWQQVTLPDTAVQAGTSYVVSYFAPQGHYAVNSNFFTSPLTDGPLKAPSGTNGVYTYSATSAFPTSSFQSTNYWVDVVFTASVPSNQPSTDIKTNAGNAFATTVAGQASATTVVLAAAEVAAVTVTSHQASTLVNAGVDVAAVTVAAPQGSPVMGVFASADLATVTVTSNQLGPDVKTSAANALATAIANQAAGVVGVSASADVASITTTANQTTSLVTLGADIAAVTATSGQTTSLGDTGAGNAAVAVTAPQPTVSVSLGAEAATVDTSAGQSTVTVSVGADNAAVAATANQTTSLVQSGADVAVITTTASPASPVLGVFASAGAAMVTAVANDATSAVSSAAGYAEVIAASEDAGQAISVSAGVAIVAVTSLSATITSSSGSVPVVAVAHDGSISIQVTAGVATVGAASDNPLIPVSGTVMMGYIEIAAVAFNATVDVHSFINIGADSGAPTSIGISDSGATRIGG